MNNRNKSFSLHNFLFFLISLAYVTRACVICLSFFSCRISVCHWVDMAFIQRARSQWASLPWLAPKAPSLFPLQTPLSTQSGSISHSQVTGTSSFSPADTQSSVGTHSDMFLILCALCPSHVSDEDPSEASNCHQGSTDMDVFSVPLSHKKGVLTHTLTFHQAAHSISKTQCWAYKTSNKWKQKWTLKLP